MNYLQKALLNYFCIVLFVVGAAAQYSKADLS